MSGDVNKYNLVLDIINIEDVHTPAKKDISKTNIYMIFHKKKIKIFLKILLAKPKIIHMTNLIKVNKNFGMIKQYSELLIFYHKIQLSL